MTALDSDPTWLNTCKLYDRTLKELNSQERYSPTLNITLLFSCNALPQPLCALQLPQLQGTGFRNECQSPFLYNAQSFLEHGISCAPSEEKVLCAGGYYNNDRKTNLWCTEKRR